MRVRAVLVLIIVQWYWPGEGQWYLVDLTAGSMRPIEGKRTVHTDSPDGRHVVYLIGTEKLGRTG